MTGLGRRIQWIVAVGSLVAAAAAIGAILVVVVTVGLGWRSFAIVSDSMDPTLRRGDLAIASDVVAGSIEPGQVVAFSRGPGAVITHRVVAIDDDAIVVRGDSSGSDERVGRDDVIGRVRVVVPWLGHPAAWYDRRQWGELGAVVVVGAAVVFAATRVQRTALVPAARRPGLAALGSFAAAGGALAVLVVSPDISEGAFTARTESLGNAVTASTPVRFYLASIGSGDRAAVAVLPLSGTAPAAGTVPNYDTNRNSDPGLTIAKGGSGPNETDLVKYQTWATTLAAPLVLDGTVRLALWSGMKDFDLGKGGSISVYLRDCTSAGSGCSTLAAGSLSRSPWNSASGFASADVDLGAISTTVAAGRSLRLTLVVDGGSGDDMWFAYGTAATPSSITIG